MITTSRKQKRNGQSQKLVTLGGALVNPKDFQNLAQVERFIEEQQMKTDRKERMRDVRQTCRARTLDRIQTNKLTDRPMKPMDRKEQPAHVRMYEQQKLNLLLMTENGTQVSQVLEQRMCKNRMMAELLSKVEMKKWSCLQEHRLPSGLRMRPGERKLFEKLMTNSAAEYADRFPIKTITNRVCKETGRYVEAMRGYHTHGQNPKTHLMTEQLTDNQLLQALNSLKISAKTNFTTDTNYLRYRINHNGSSGVVWECNFMMQLDGVCYRSMKLGPNKRTAFVRAVRACMDNLYLGTKLDLPYKNLDELECEGDFGAAEGMRTLYNAICNVPTWILDAAGIFRETVKKFFWCLGKFVLYMLSIVRDFSLSNVLINIAHMCLDFGIDFKSKAGYVKDFITFVITLVLGETSVSWIKEAISELFEGVKEGATEAKSVADDVYGYVKDKTTDATDFIRQRTRIPKKRRNRHDLRKTRAFEDDFADEIWYAEEAIETSKRKRLIADACVDELRNDVHNFSYEQEETSPVLVDVHPLPKDVLGETSPLNPFDESSDDDDYHLASRFPPEAWSDNPTYIEKKQPENLLDLETEGLRDTAAYQKAVDLCSNPITDKGWFSAGMEGVKGFVSSICEKCFGASAREGVAHFFDQYWWPARDLFCFAGGIRNIALLVEMITKYTHRLVCHLSGGTSPEELSNKYYQDNKDMILAWHENAQELIANNDPETLAKSPNSRARVAQLYDQGVNYERGLMCGKTPQHLFSQFRSLFAKITELQNTCTKGRQYAFNRPEPVVIHIYGEPGQGKSVMSTVLVNAFAKFFDMHPDLASHSMNAQTKHMDGYTGQPILIIDDLGQDPEAEDFRNFCNMVSTTPYIVPKADLKSKGTYFTSPLVICTSNQAEHRPKTITDHGAVARRFLFHIEMTTKQQYWKTEENQTLDFAKALAANHLLDGEYARLALQKDAPGLTRGEISLEELVKNVCNELVVRQINSESIKATPRDYGPDYDILYANTKVKMAEQRISANDAVRLAREDLTELEEEGLVDLAITAADAAAFTYRMYRRWKNRYEPALTEKDYENIANGKRLEDEPKETWSDWALRNARRPLDAMRNRFHRETDYECVDTSASLPPVDYDDEDAFLNLPEPPKNSKLERDAYRTCPPKCKCKRCHAIRSRLHKIRDSKMIAVASGDVFPLEKEEAAQYIAELKEDNELRGTPEFYSTPRLYGGLPDKKIDYDYEAIFRAFVGEDHPCKGFCYFCKEKQRQYNQMNCGFTKRENIVARNRGKRADGIYCGGVTHPRDELNTEEAVFYYMIRDRLMKRAGHLELRPKDKAGHMAQDLINLLELEGVGDKFILALIANRESEEEFVEDIRRLCKTRSLKKVLKTYFSDFIVASVRRLYQSYRRVINIERRINNQLSRHVPYYHQIKETAQMGVYYGCMIGAFTLLLWLVGKITNYILSYVDPNIRKREKIRQLKIKKQERQAELELANLETQTIKEQLEPYDQRIDQLEKEIKDRFLGKETKNTETETAYQGPSPRVKKHQLKFARPPVQVGHLTTEGLDGGDRNCINQTFLCEVWGKNSEGQWDTARGQVFYFDQRRAGVNVHLLDSMENPQILRTYIGPTRDAFIDAHLTMGADGNVCRVYVGNEPQDYCIIQVPPVGGIRDVRKHMSKGEMLYKPNRLLIVSRDRDGNNVTMRETTPDNWTGFNYHHGERAVTNGVTYTSWTGTKGDSGSLILDEGDLPTVRVVGFHLAGNGGRGLGVVLTRAEIDPIFDYLDKKFSKPVEPPNESTIVQCVEEGLKVPTPGTTRHLGAAPISVHMCRETSLQPTVIHGEIREPLRQPPVLSSSDQRPDPEARGEPVLNSTSKYEAPIGSAPIDKVSRAVQHVGMKMAAMTIDKPRVLSTTEAVNGMGPGRALGPIEFGKSPGAPYVKGQIPTDVPGQFEKVPGYQPSLGKRPFFELDPEGNFSLSPHYSAV